ncbi:RWD domain-containing protein 3 [Ambystoma mexicanum]|uniref:RWD domain-containing protein 3 n=1 Tax=Ambystoma mexicanum TaxID=8296 RepID=UPI0037E82BAA
MSDYVAMEEVSALAAIYCEKGEFELLQTSEIDGITLRIQTCAKGHLEPDKKVTLTFNLPTTYPTCPPNICVASEDLTRAQCEDLKRKLMEYAQELICEPMIHELVLWTQQSLENTRNGLDVPDTAPKDKLDDRTWTALLQLDHMRSKTKYVRTVEKWASDFCLTGRLMFMGKLILILLQGEKDNIKEYLILQKTSKVDVDSCGKKCKEKMISVLHEAKAQPEQLRFDTFEVHEYSSLNDLQREFEAARLGHIFTDLVLTQFR